MNPKEKEIIRKLPIELLFPKSTLKKLEEFHNLTSNRLNQLRSSLAKDRPNLEKEFDKIISDGTNNFSEYLKGNLTIPNISPDVELSFERVINKNKYFSQQIESLKEKKIITYHLFRCLENYSNNFPQQYNIPKIVPIEKDGKVSLRLDTGKRWLKFGEETFNSLLEIFYPGHENTLKHKELKDLVFKEKREIFLKI